MLVDGAPVDCTKLTYDISSKSLDVFRGTSPTPTMSWEISGIDNSTEKSANPSSPEPKGVKKDASEFFCLAFYDDSRKGHKLCVDSEDGIQNLREAITHSMSDNAGQNYGAKPSGGFFNPLSIFGQSASSQDDDDDPRGLFAIFIYELNQMMKLPEMRRFEKDFVQKVIRQYCPLLAGFI